jgi:hypothetical protein
MKTTTMPVVNKMSFRIAIPNIPRLPVSAIVMMQARSKRAISKKIYNRKRFA